MYKNTDDDNKSSLINFVIYTCSSLKIWDRIQIAFEILMGKKYCMWISKDQESNHDI